MQRRRMGRSSSHISIMAVRMYGSLTFSSHNKGRWSKISRGSASAVRMMTSEIPRLRVLVAKIPGVGRDHSD